MQVVVLLIFAGLPCLALSAIDLLFARHAVRDPDRAGAPAEELAPVAARSSTRLALVIDNDRSEAVGTI